MTDQPDEMIHQPIRLKIMAALNALPAQAETEFMTLKSLLQTTNGNLGAHITALEGSGYVTVKKDFVGNKPRTRVRITKGGRSAFGKYLAFMREIVESATTQGREP